jgi:hypothetical protein
MRSSIRAFTLCAMGLLAGCAAGPHIRVDKDPTADMGEY